jgi:hypothetical protein
MGLRAIATVADWVAAGFPREVAERIVSGELPMDDVSRAMRAQEQGYGDVLWRGHGQTFNTNSDIWASSSQDVAQTYADEFALPFLTPIRHTGQNLAEVNARGKGYDSVQTNAIKVPGIASGVYKGTDDIAEAVRDSEQYDGVLFRNIKDEFGSVRGAEQADTYNILGSRDDVNIRHADAAFDPQYVGPNIKGNADPRLLAGTAAATAGGLGLLASDDADAIRLDSSRHNKYGRGGMVAAPAGVLATGARAEDQPRSAREAGFPDWPVYEDPNTPLPLPTGWDIFDSVVNVLGMPMAGVQGLARGVYGLATGEDLTTAGAEAAHMMGSEHEGSLMTPGYDTDEGWRRYGALTEDTFNEAGVPEPVSKGLGLFNQWVPQLFMPF